MSEAKLANLVRKLHQNTRAQRLRWRKTARDAVYEVTFSEYSARISERRISQNDIEYVLSVCDKNGVVIEELTESRFASPEPANEVGVCLKDLYNWSVMQATGTDHAIDSILKEL